MLKGIHAVFKGMPLFWGRGYLGRALAVMERAASGDVKLSKDTVRTDKFNSVFHFTCVCLVILAKNHHHKKTNNTFLLIINLFIIHMFYLIDYQNRHR